IAEITRRHPAARVAAALATAGVPHSPITPVEELWELPFVRDGALGTEAPDGRPVRLPPPALSTPHLEEIGGRLPFSPGYGEHTDAVLAEAGVSEGEIAGLRSRGIVA
ncbi:MAG: CoA transferase, partial [Planctomycetota bacterium]